MDTTADIIATLAFIAIAIISVVWAFIAQQNAAAPTYYGSSPALSTNRFASPDNVGEKMAEMLRNDSPKWVHVSAIKQSGAHHRVISDGSMKEAGAAIATAMRRAKIDTVYMTFDFRGHLVMDRTMHNGRGSQEGQKIGGFIVQFGQ